MDNIPEGTWFTVAPPSTNKKYIAHLPSGKKIAFGHRGREHYRDRIPKSIGGGYWSKYNHLDPKRRKKYHSSKNNKTTAQYLSAVCLW